MIEHVENTQSEPSPKGFKGFLKKSGNKAFWVWVVYQAIKGILTTSLIWVPMIYFWWTH
ncbi:MAG: hypothetical protein OEY94_00900 [Alphaproteobacteria bacterium]|nr:hypothetical protein [Alphaproteobacteria bacterium]